MAASPAGMGARKPRARAAVLVLLGAPQSGRLAAGGSDYVKLVNGRCAELVGVLPLGRSGRNWTSGMDLLARDWCDRRSWCAGYMRYVGDDPNHCADWCGRPQFCHEVDLSIDDGWVSYLRRAAPEDGAGRAEAAGDASARGPEDVECPGPHLGPVTLWYSQPEAAQVGSRGTADSLEGQDACHVLYHRRGQPAPWLGAAWPASVHGVLSEDEAVAPHFTANASAEPWVYSVDSNEYVGETAEGTFASFGPKLHFLSFFFLTPASRCDGTSPLQWGPGEVEELMPGHVYVDDGSTETRRSAFNPYHFAVICGEADQAGFVPQALVDAVGFAAHPLLSKRMHSSLHRAFFHLPDAVQPYTKMHPVALEAYVEDMYNDPGKNQAMLYKQTFLFLLQELFRYRYRQPLARRLASAACALCAERGRRSRLEAASGRGAGGDPEAVGIAVCVMSRRSGLALRRGIRETWASELAAGTAVRFFVGARDAGGGGERAVEDAEAGDVVELDAPEAYNAVTLKAFAMLDWASRSFPNLRFLVRADDDVYLRPGPLLRQLERRPPVAYLWGNFDHGSNPVRDPEHPHYNSYEQLPERRHPMFGDILPPYARGSLWAMSADLLSLVAAAWRGELERYGGGLTLELASRLPHPDDPALGVALAGLVDRDQFSLNVDDRDLNVFALNPSCNASYLNMHRRTWAVHHVSAGAMRCMWALDSAAGGCVHSAQAQGCPAEMPDLCPCSLEEKVVEEEEDMDSPDALPFWYPRDRFNE